MKLSLKPIFLVTMLTPLLAIGAESETFTNTAAQSTLLRQKHYGGRANSRETE